jgi:hypothetical protein
VPIALNGTVASRNFLVKRIGFELAGDVEIELTNFYSANMFGAFCIFVLVSSYGISAEI